MGKYIGDKTFYRKTLTLAIPIVIQNGITNFVNLLDNIMVGQVGTEAMTGVSIVNQLLFVFNLCIFGAVSGAGIFGAQFYGKGDNDGLRYTFRFKAVICATLGVLGITVFSLFGEALISLYLQGEGSAESIAASLRSGKEYLAIMAVGLIPFAAVQTYSSTLRETGQTIVPMKAGIAAVLVNLCGNYVLIFGKFGMPAMGATGAAIATVASRFVEVLIIALWTHSHRDKNKFISGAFRSLYIPGKLCGRIAVKGLPLLVNEALWSVGMSTLVQCYSVRGYEVVSAVNITSTINQLGSIAFMALGSAISIVVGQALGAGERQRAVDSARKLIAFSLMISAFCCVITIFLAPYIPQFYKVSDGVKAYAASFIRVAALCMPVHAFANASYFTLRSGGRTGITFIFDSGFIWAVSVPLAFFLSRFTELDILPLYFICQFVEIIKCVFGFWLVKKQIWVRNMVEEY